MDVETVVLPADEHYPLHISANCYKPASRSNVDEGVTEVTLILTHATGVHKETWEPLLQHLFSKQTNAGFTVVEAWAIEAPNHGKSALLNEDVLNARHQEECTSRHDIPMLAV
jgi:hypothetical protein